MVVLGFAEAKESQNRRPDPGLYRAEQNPPDGSRGIFQVQPTRRDSLNRIPPMAVGGSFKSNPKAAEAGLETSTHCRGWDS